MTASQRLTSLGTAVAASHPMTFHHGQLYRRGAVLVAAIWSTQTAGLCSTSIAHAGPHPEAPFQGTFSTNHGELRLVQVGARVYGDYADRGVIEGTYDGGSRTLRGVFTNGDRQGVIVFTLAEAGNSFSGLWSWTNPASMQWSGRRTGSGRPTLLQAAHLDARHDPAPFEGTFASTYGDLRLVRAGDRVYGDYADRGIIDGRYDEATRTLTGIFTNGDRQGVVEFVLDASGGAFSGTWNWAGPPTLRWSGRRIASVRPTLVRAASLDELYNPLTFEGVFSSTYGDLRLAQAGSRVFGDYADRGIIYGSYDAATRSLSGIFTNGDRQGVIEFVLDESGDAFTGRWSWSGPAVINWSGHRTADKRPRLVQAAALEALHTSEADRLESLPFWESTPIQQAFRQALASGLESAADAVDWTSHLAATSRVLSLLDRTHIKFVVAELDVVERALQEHGPDPFPSVLVELAYRLGRLPEAAYQSAYERLIELGNSYRGEPSQAGIHILLRSPTGQGFRAYGPSVGRAMVGMAFSTFGRQQFALGQPPGAILRSAAMYESCTDIDKVLPPEVQEVCDEFGADLNDDSGGGGWAPDFSGGIMMGSRACLTQAANSGLGEQIARVEATVACLLSEREVTPEQTLMNHPEGSRLPVVHTPKVSIPGWEHVSGPERYVVPGPEGPVYSVTNNFKKGSARMSITDLTETQDGQIKRERIISTEKNGKVTRLHRDNNGKWSAEPSEGTPRTTYRDGSVTDVDIINEDGSSAEVTTDTETGETTIVVKDTDGNKQGEATVDKDGKCTGSACSISQPPEGEIWGSSCLEHTDLGGDMPVLNPLDPLIYPHPEDVGSIDDPFLRCLSNTFDTDTEVCPPSVALCIEPNPHGEYCGCGRPGPENYEGDFFALQCAQMYCATGHCDPTTGTCTSGADGDLGGVFPGSPQPRPDVPAPAPRSPDPLLDGGRGMVLSWPGLDPNRSEVILWIPPTDIGSPQTLRRWTGTAPGGTVILQSQPEVVPITPVPAR